MRYVYALLILVFLNIALSARVPQTNSFTIGNFTIDATGSPVVAVQPPTRAGRLALVADIPPAPPQASVVIAGSAVLVNGLVTVIIPAQIAPPVCVAVDTTAASPVRRVAVTVSSVSFEGVSNHSLDYLCTPKNN